MAPDSTAVRVALWRAQHVLLDAEPHVLEDELGAALAAPADGWQERPDMNPRWTAPFRAHIVARARFVEDLVIEQLGRGVRQYVILGAGLDTFAQRRPDVASRLHMFEIDQPETSAWKRRRLGELGYPVPDWLHLVSLDFEQPVSWRDALIGAGFEAAAPATVVSTGVTQYLTHQANTALLGQIAALAPGTTAAITFMLPVELLPHDERPATQAATDGARRSGTPFISLYGPDAFVALARHAGFREVRHVSTAEIRQRYFAERTDGLSPAHGEQLIVATV
jgi:methyltransferase (TIGR00027 family)